jgi:hypothetical protein
MGTCMEMNCLSTAPISAATIFIVEMAEFDMTAVIQRTWGCFAACPSPTEGESGPGWPRNPLAIVAHRSKGVNFESKTISVLGF